MKKLGKIVIALGMCATLVCSTLCMSLAASAKTYKNLPYKYYTYLGDSIPWGYGLDPNNDSSDPYNVGGRVEGAYTDLVGDVLEKNNNAHVQPAAGSGARICDFRILLERGMGIEHPYDRENDWYGNRKPERVVRLRAMGPEICSWISKSDLISFQAGINDMTAVLGNSAVATGLIEPDKLMAIDGLDGLMEYLDWVIDHYGKDSRVVTNFVKTFTKEFNETMTNCSVVVKDIQMLAPDNADIVLVGYHKAVAGIRVIPGTNSSLLFDIVDQCIMNFNAMFKIEAAKYDNVYYVDAPDASVVFKKGTTVVDILKNTDGFLLGIHPDAAGHKYIANCVLKKLKEINA